MIIIIHDNNISVRLSTAPSSREARQDSSKGGAVETGCSDLHYLIYVVLLHNTTPIHCNPLQLHTPLMNTQPGVASGLAFSRVRPISPLALWHSEGWTQAQSQI